MDPMTRISLIVAVAGSITGAVVSVLLSKMFKGKKEGKITIKFEDGQIKTLELSPDASQEERERKIRKAVEEKMPLSPLQRFKTYVLHTMVTIGMFALFVLVAMAVRLFGKPLDSPPSVIIVSSIVAVTILVFGGLACVMLIVRNTIEFIRSHVKHSPRRTLRQKS